MCAANVALEAARAAEDEASRAFELARGAEADLAFELLVLRQQDVSEAAARQAAAAAVMPVSLGKLFDG